MSVCHGDRARVQQQVYKLRRQLDQVLGQEEVEPLFIERVRRELLQASEALARLPDCSE